MLAAAGLFALENNIDRLADDHKHAEEMAAVIKDTGNNRYLLTQLIIAYVDS